MQWYDWIIAAIPLALLFLLMALLCYRPSPWSSSDDPGLERMAEEADAYYRRSMNMTDRGMARIETIDAVEDHPHPEGTHLSIMTIGDKKAVSMRVEGSTPGVYDTHRYLPGAHVIAIYEGAIVPDDVLKNGFWNEDKGIGTLAGGKRKNRMKPSNFKEFRSEFIMFPVETTDEGLVIRRGEASLVVTRGDDVSEFLGITENA